MSEKEERARWVSAFLRLVGSGGEFHPKQLSEYVSLQTRSWLTEKQSLELLEVAAKLGAKTSGKKARRMLGLWEVGEPPKRTRKRAEDPRQARLPGL